MAKVLPSDVAERIARAFPWVKGESRESVPHPANQQQALNWIAGVLALVEQIPDSLLRFDSDEYGSFLWAQAGLRQLAESFRNGSSNPPWPTVENNNAMTILWRLLKKCPDEAVSEHTAGLPFIQDESLRISIQSDISSAESSFNNGQWKAATILAAATVEALLLWSISQCYAAERESAIQNCKPKLKLNAARPEERDWDLASYIAVASQLGHIKPATSTQAGLAKDFRNLIHPGREIRLNQKCDRGTARSALAALDHVVRDLGAWRK